MAESLLRGYDTLRATGGRQDDHERGPHIVTDPGRRGTKAVASPTGRTTSDAGPNKQTVASSTGRTTSDAEPSKQDRCLAYGRTTSGAGPNK